MESLFHTIVGILIPFFGTVFGSGAVFIWKKPMGNSTKKVFFGFAAGVMMAASVWSLIIPALEQGGPWLATAGILSGIGLFLLGDLVLSLLSKKAKRTARSGADLVALAVTMHNLPEGMAVGVVFAGALAAGMPLTPALALSLGIAIQNFPEGAIISMPLAGVGVSKKKSFVLGALSGAVEPLGAVTALLLTEVVAPALPLILSFAAGAMLYVVIQELIPEIHGGKGEKEGCFAVGAGFCLMMLLDVILGG